MLKMVGHASQDRIERMMYLTMEIGIGETLISVVSQGRRTDLTENGIVLVYADDGESILTAYLASVDRAYAMYNQRYNGKFPVPKKVMRHINSVNTKHARVIKELNLYYGYCE